MWYVYVLRSWRDNNLYVGSTNDISRRLSEYNSGKVDSTKNRRPFSLKHILLLKTSPELLSFNNILRLGRGGLSYKNESFSHRSSVGA